MSTIVVCLTSGMDELFLLDIVLRLESVCKGVRFEMKADVLEVGFLTKHHGEVSKVLHDLSLMFR